MDRNEFSQQILNAYQHLYDLVHLRTHPLTDHLVTATSLSRKEKAWHLHRILEDVIKELDPGPQAPISSREWRRHRLMVLRYLDGLDPQAVADELGISRRHYYREHETTIEAIASILWNRYVTRAAATNSDLTAVDQSEANHLSLLRAEAARVAPTDHHVRLDDVVDGVLSLLQEMLQKQQVDIEIDLPDTLPKISIDRGLLRNILLGILGYMIEGIQRTTIRLTAHQEKAVVRMSLKLKPSGTIPGTTTEARERLASIKEMATLSSAEVQPEWVASSIIGFHLLLPTKAERTVLVVDDNEDVLELIHRYLSLHTYRVITAQTGQEAISLAQQLQPDVITLDLMMPDQDGWDLLQTLLNQVETRHIPIIVCSVLKQRDLALSLGATAFVEKPVTEQTLLATLAALEEN